MSAQKFHYFDIIRAEENDNEARQQILAIIFVQEIMFWDQRLFQ